MARHISVYRWALTLQKRVGGEQVHEDYDYNVHKMDQFLSHATVNNKTPICYCHIIFTLKLKGRGIC